MPSATGASLSHKSILFFQKWTNCICTQHHVKSIMLDSGFALQLVLHFVRNTQQSESKSQSALEFILLFFDFHQNQLTLLLLLLQSNITGCKLNVDIAYVVKRPL